MQKTKWDILLSVVIICGQDEFKVAHKAVDALRSSSNLQPQDLNADIRQLDKEKEQVNLVFSGFQWFMTFSATKFR